MQQPLRTRDSARSIRHDAPWSEWRRLLEWIEERTAQENERGRDPWSGGPTGSGS